MSEKDSTTIQTVTPTGTPVPDTARFSDAGVFHSIYKRLYDEDNTNGRARKRATVQGIIDGNPIYPDSDLRKDGQGWRANFNPREAEGIRNANAAALWSLIFSTEFQVEVKSRINTLTPADINEQCQKIARNYTDTMLAWDDYLPHVLVVTNDIVAFGIGYLFWFDPFDFRPTSIPHGAVKLPPRTKATLEGMDVLFVEDSIPAHRLLALVGNDKASDIGWNVAEIKKVLVRRYAAKVNNGNDKDVKYDVSSWESAQQQIKNNDLGDSFGEMEGIPVVWGFVKSADGKTISQYCVENTVSIPLSGRAFMFEQHGKRNNLSECGCPFFYNIGDGYVRSIKGQMQSLYPQLLTGARMLLATIDAALLSATVVVQDQGGTDMRMTKLGPITRIPQGTMPIQTSFQPRLEGLIAVRTLMAQLMNQNAGVYKMSPEQVGRTGQPATAEQVRAESENEARLESFQAMLFYLHLDRMHREIMRRLLSDIPEGVRGYEESKAFVKKCKDDGVNADLLKAKNLIVRASRAIGYGSAKMASMISQNLFEIASKGGYDQIGRREAIRRMTAVLVGWDQVDALAPRQNRDEVATNETSIAVLENDTIRNGGTVAVGTDQNHSLHAEAVISLLAPLADAYVAGKNGTAQPVDPRAILPAFNVGVKHLSQHIAEGAGGLGNEDLFKGYAKVRDQLEGVRKALVRDAQTIMLREQEAAQQQQPQPSPEELDIMRKNAAAQSDIERRNALAAADVRRKDVKAGSDIRRKDAMAAHKIGMDRLELLPKLQPNEQPQGGMTPEEGGM